MFKKAGCAFLLLKIARNVIYHLNNYKNIRDIHTRAHAHTHTCIQHFFILSICISWNIMEYILQRIRFTKVKSSCIYLCIYRNRKIYSISI